MDAVSLELPKHTEKNRIIFGLEKYSFSVVLLKSSWLIRGKLVWRINDKLCCSFQSLPHHTPALMDYG